MTSPLSIPFHPNTGDGTHCWQAALMMVLSAFEPEIQWNYDELDRISAKQPGKWTWPTASMLWLLERGYELRLIEEFDYYAFGARGESYLIDRCGPDVAAAQIAHSDIASELEFARRFAALAPMDLRLPTLEDIQQLLADGFAVICNLNSAKLYGMSGYSAHFVVVVSADERVVTIHDPGLPPKPFQCVPTRHFLQAWAYPSEREKNLLALRKEKKPQ